MVMFKSSTNKRSFVIRKNIILWNVNYRIVTLYNYCDIRRIKRYFKKSCCMLLDNKHDT